MEEKTKILEGELDNETIFPWDDVNACIDTECLPIFRSLGENKPCPICGTPSDKLKWIEFRSPQWTWDNLMGRGGPLSICEKCHKQVEFIRIFMN